MKESDTIARNVGENCDIDISPIAFGGHCVYVRKCRPGQQFGDDPAMRQIGGIVLPDWTQYDKKRWKSHSDKCEWVQVLAKGLNVGRPASKYHQKKFGRARWFGDAIEVGMLAHVKQEKGDGIKRSPISDCEYFIEESWLDCYWQPGENNE